jgi:glycosyltransferase involved in cell wall biosynthesis
MKIMIFNNLYYPDSKGGAEVSVQILAEGLTGYGHGVTVLTTSINEHVEYLNGVKIYYLCHPGQYWFKDSKKKNSFARLYWHFYNFFSTAIIKKIDMIIRKEKPDIAHTNNLFGMSRFVWAVLYKNRIPVVHTLRDYFLLCRKSTLYSNGKNCQTSCITCRAQTYLFRKYSKCVDTVVGISNYVLDRHIGKNFFPESTREVIFNPINIENNMTKLKTNEPVIFGYAGLLTKSKGIEVLLDTFKNNTDLPALFVFGSGENKQYESFLLQKYQTEKIKFFGYKKTEEIFKVIDALIMPSLWQEPFGRIIIEAYYYGVPVIASSRGGIPEIVEDGKTGLLFDPFKEDDLTEKIRILIKNPGILVQMSKKCSEVLKKFESGKITNKYLEVYKKAISHKSDCFLK